MLIGSTASRYGCQEGDGSAAGLWAMMSPAAACTMIAVSTHRSRLGSVIMAGRRVLKLAFSAKPD
jgi:hypothetical protein